MVGMRQLCMCSLDQIGDMLEYDYHLQLCRQVISRMHLRLGQFWVKLQCTLWHCFVGQIWTYFPVQSCNGKY